MEAMIRPTAGITLTTRTPNRCLWSKPASADGYTEAEAKQEAARCLRCDCELCINACEMLKSFNKKPHRMAVEAFTDLQASVLSSRLMTRETYSCNICGYCKSICPENVDLGGLLQLSRSARIGTASHPAAFHDFWLREMDFAASEGRSTALQREKDLRICLFPGLPAWRSRPEYVFRSFDYIKDHYDAGVILDCCGAPHLLGRRRSSPAAKYGKAPAKLDRYGKTDADFRLRDLREHVSSVSPRDQRSFPL